MRAFTIALAMACTAATAYRPGVVRAQSASDVAASSATSASTWDFALTTGTAKQPFDERYVGVTAQFAARRGQWWWLGAQTGALGSISGARACDVAPGSRCYSAPSGFLYLAPLAGVGVHRGPLLVRATAGPRITVNNPSPFRGAQASGELSLGNERGALYVPFTWSSSKHGDETLVLRTIGFGIQVR